MLRKWRGWCSNIGFLPLNSYPSDINMKSSPNISYCSVKELDWFRVQSRHRESVSKLNSECLKDCTGSSTQNLAIWEKIPIFTKKPFFGNYLYLFRQTLFLSVLSFIYKGCSQRIVAISGADGALYFLAKSLMNKMLGSNDSARATLLGVM